jgi:hypothetical protein
MSGYMPWNLSDLVATKITDTPTRKFKPWPSITVLAQLPWLMSRYELLLHGVVQEGMNICHMNSDR